MLDAEMQIVDLRPTGFFNFDLDKYKDRLVAGYERTLPDLGLEVYMLGLKAIERRCNDNSYPVAFPGAKTDAQSDPLLSRSLTGLKSNRSVVPGDDSPAHQGCLVQSVASPERFGHFLRRPSS